MFDSQRHTGTAAASGDIRIAAVLALAGSLLLVSTMTGLWAGQAVVPVALAVAMLVFGTFLGLSHWGTGARGRASRRAGIEAFESHVEPVFMTGLDGALIAANPAASSAGGLEDWLPDAAASRYRLTREVRANGVAIEETDSGVRAVVTLHGPKSLLWRIERDRNPARPAPDFASASVPWLRIDPEGRVLETNAAASELSARLPDKLEDMLCDLPLRPEGVHVLNQPGQAVRAIVLSGDDGNRDVLLMPLDGAEISGLVPEHFLEELPVALARLEPAGGLTYANKAARQLLRHPPHHAAARRRDPRGGRRHRMAAFPCYRGRRRRFPQRRRRQRTAQNA